MNRRGIVRLAVAAWASVSWPAPAAAQQAVDPLARLDAAQRRAVDAFLDRTARPGDGAGQADQVELADLDGDGRPEVVLLWTFLGPTYWHSHVAVFAQAGNAWRERGKFDVAGMPQKMSIDGRVVRIDTLVLGPKDPRCCPTVAKVQRLQWTAGKLVSSGR